MPDRMNSNMPWEVYFPNESLLRGRALRAQRPSDGAVVQTWTPDGSKWRREDHRTHWDTFGQVIGVCIDRGWRLYSVPAEREAQP